MNGLGVMLNLIPARQAFVETPIWCGADVNSEKLDTSESKPICVSMWCRQRSLGPWTPPLCVRSPPHMCLTTPGAHAFNTLQSRRERHAQTRSNLWHSIGRFSRFRQRKRERSYLYNANSYIKGEMLRLKKT